MTTLTEVEETVKRLELEREHATQTYKATLTRIDNQKAETLMAWDAAMKASKGEKL